MSSELIFQVKNLTRRFSVRKGFFRRGNFFHALEAVTLEFRQGRYYGVAGESGSGKSTLARLLTGLIPPDRGEIFFRGRPLQDWLRRDPAGFRRRVQIVFQNPYRSLDPKWTVSALIGEGLVRVTNSERRRRVQSVLEEVGLPSRYLKRRPVELSGGERQRIAIARAVVMRPEYLILDEPTSELDVTVQAQITGLLKAMRSRFPGGMMFISHDLALLSSLVDEMIILKGGKVLETGVRREVIGSPRHPYTRLLLDALPPWGIHELS